MKSKRLKINDVCRYMPTSAMVTGPRSVGWFDTEQDKHLKGSLVKILNYKGDGIYFGVFIATPGKSMDEVKGHFVEECLAPVMDDRRISMRPWNKPNEST